MRHGILRRYLNKTMGGSSFLFSSVHAEMLSSWSEKYTIVRVCRAMPPLIRLPNSSTIIIKVSGKLVYFPGFQNAVLRVFFWQFDRVRKRISIENLMLRPSVLGIVYLR